MLIGINSLLAFFFLRNLFVKLCPSGICILALESISLSILINREIHVSTANLHEFCYATLKMVFLDLPTTVEGSSMMQTDCFRDIRFGNIFLHPWILLIIKKKFSEP